MIVLPCTQYIKIAAKGQKGVSKPILLLAVHAVGKGELQRVRGKEAAVNRIIDQLLKFSAGSNATN